MHYLANPSSIDPEGRPHGGWTNDETFAVASWIFESDKRMCDAWGKSPAELHLMTESAIGRDNSSLIHDVDWGMLAREYTL